MPRGLRRPKDGEGNTVYIEAGAFREKDGSIHMVIFGLENGHVSVTSNGKSTRGHTTLHKRLDEALTKVGLDQEQG
ncbi:MAG: hypothetical protein OXI37_03195 [Gammaproteobacteria bacterium]|nr:hypothetical protein [Gammaproteobacteria bacterium]